MCLLFDSALKKTPCSYCRRYYGKDLYWVPGELCLNPFEKISLSAFSVKSSSVVVPVRVSGEGNQCDFRFSTKERQSLKRCKMLVLWKR